MPETTKTSDMVMVPREPSREQQLAMQKALLDNWPKLIGDDVCVNGRLLDAVYEAALSAPSTTSTAGEACVACEGKPAPVNNPCAVCGAVAPTPGEGEAPVAWRIESVASPGEAWEWIEGREPTEYVGDPAFVVRRYASDTARPTPATPEGLREKLIGLHIEARPLHESYAVMVEITSAGADAILSLLFTPDPKS